MFSQRYSVHFRVSGLWSGITGPTRCIQTTVTDCCRKHDHSWRLRFSVHHQEQTREDKCKSVCDS